MTISSSLTTRRSNLTASLEIIEVKPGMKFDKATLLDILPDIETALFFGKVYELNHVQLSALLARVFNTPLVNALLNDGGMHSNELQDYLVDLSQHVPEVELGDLCFNPTVPHGEILPHMWEDLQVQVASSIKQVADKLSSVINKMPGKQGAMAFKSLAVMNAKRPTIGDYRAHIQHTPQAQNLVILDVSGSMTETTIRTIVDDVVALSYQANAHLAIVSESCTYWEPGTFDSDSVLQAAEFWGTRYEKLAPLFDRDWGVVVTIADYDSSPAAYDVLSRSAGRIDTVLDVSLVNQPTYLAKCIGQLAGEVRPLLVGNSYDVLS